MKTWALPGLLSFNGGFVDTTGVIAKLLALPEFVAVVALARMTGAALRKWRMDALRLLLVAKANFLFAFFVLGVAFGPFPDSGFPAALFTRFTGIAGMAIANAHIPPTTLMTGNTPQAVLDAVDLARDAPMPDAAPVRARLRRPLRGIVWFAAGCAVAALLYYWFACWCLAVPVAVGVAAAILRDVGGPSQAATPASSRERTMR
jgi:uncharacterized membrane protein YoaK (UPF0700 family)